MTDLARLIEKLEAIAEYAAHLPGCELMLRGEGPEFKLSIIRPCNCGLSDARDGLASLKARAALAEEK